MVSAVLFVAIIHEPGCDFNSIIIPALKGAGDIRFPVYVGIALKKANPRLKELVLVKNTRLSAQPVSQAQWKIICGLI